MKTSFLLMAQYDGLAVIPVEWVCRDYFRHLTVEKFLRKVLVGEISLPIVRIKSSQKSAKGVRRERPRRVSRQASRRGAEGMRAAKALCVVRCCGQCSTKNQ